MVKRLYIDLTVPSELEPEKSPPKRRRGPPRKAKNNIEKDSRTVVLPSLPALTPPPAPSPEPCFACNNTTSISYAEILGLDSEHSGCTVCMRCIISTICHSLSGQKALCPVPTCQKEFEDEEVQLLVSEEDYQEYIQRANTQPVEWPKFLNAPAPSPPVPCFVCNITSISYVEILGLDSEHQECTVCMRCIIGTIRNSPTGQKVRCPSQVCRKELGDKEVQLLVPEEDHQAYIQRANTQSIECSVCLDPKFPDAYPDQITSSCHETHDRPGACITCMQDLLSNALDGKEWIHPSCPDCNAKLSISDVQRFGTATQVETFDARLTKIYMQSLDEYRQCLRPGCGDGQIHDGGAENPLVICKSCRFKTCFTHNIPFHEGMTCTQYDVHVRQRDKAMKKSEKFVKKNCKSCPGCKFDIMKNGGCDHMTCRRCGHEFCWLCLAPYEGIRREGNSAHQTTCKHYRQNESRPIENRRGEGAQGMRMWDVLARGLWLGGPPS